MKFWNNSFHRGMRLDGSMEPDNGAETIPVRRFVP